MMRWGHGHSIATGVVVGLLLSRRPELVFAAGVVVGVVAVHARRIVAALEQRLASRRRPSAVVHDWPMPK